jgi:hypothetical protein
MLSLPCAEKACALATAITLTTGRASLCALGESLNRHGVFAPLGEQGKIPQKTVRHRPTDTRLDGLLGMLWEAKTLSQSHGTSRVDPAVPRACGRQGCADPSTLARTLRACTAATVAPGAQGCPYARHRSGQTPHPRCAERLVGVDVDGTPMPRGAPAEGSARPWRGRQRRKTGRQTWRGTARDSRASLHETLLRGKASVVPTLQAARGELATRRGWARERRQRIVRRLDGGCGTTEVRHGLRRRGSQVVAQSVTAGEGASGARRSGRGSRRPAPGGRSRP